MNVATIDILSQAWREIREDPFSIEEVVTMISEGLASCVDGVPLDSKEIYLCLDDADDVDWRSMFFSSRESLFSLSNGNATPRTFIVGIAAICFEYCAIRRGIGFVSTADDYLLKFVCHHMEIGGTASKMSLLRKICAERADELSS